MSEVFLDSSFAIALAAPSDQHHQRAVELSNFIRSNRIRLVTTRAVILEIGNALSRRQYRQAAVKLLSSIESDPAIEIVPLSAQLWKAAFDLFRARLDKDWGLTDCVSFVTMHERGLTDALSADKHFRQAGYRPLLIETQLSENPNGN